MANAANNWRRRRLARILVPTLLFPYFLPALALAQAPPRPLASALAFSESVPTPDEPVEVSPLTPREPPPLAPPSKKLVPLKPLAPTPDAPLSVPHPAPSRQGRGQSEGSIQQASYKLATTGLLDDASAVEAADCEHCGPGQRRRSACEGGFCQRFCSGCYHGICCHDPCYESTWVPLADAAFFTAAVRPVSQLRIRWDGGYNVTLPDRAEYFWARADGQGQGPLPAPGALAATRLRYQEARFYLETAIDTLSVFVEAPYRSQDAVDADARSGFGDLAAGFKTLLYDCELLQIAGQLRVEIPTGNGRKGLGVEHTSLEPSLLCGLRLAPHTYLQLQVAEWIPLDGDETYAGAILHYHASLNHVLVRFLPDVPLIGVAEFAGYTFQDGAYTDPISGTVSANNDTYLYASGGLRLFLGRAVDLGLSVRNALTDQHLEGTLYRAEFRWRF